MKILGIADTDSYLKWGSATLGRVPADWERSLVLVDTPFVPTVAQRRSAVEGLADSSPAPEVLGLDALGDRIAQEQPDVVFLSLRGPLIRVVIRVVLAASTRRPVLVSGLPGISIPATAKALAFRSQVDLMVLHSRREIDEFESLADRLGLQQQFGLATLPFLRDAQADGGARAGEPRDEIVFAVQAKVPPLRVERLAILQSLADCARRNPGLRVVLKLRALSGEPQTHVEEFPYDLLLDELAKRPANLFAETGSMSAHLAKAVGLATVSSTALVEAIAVGVPGVALDDFGVTPRLINTVFEGSGLFGSGEDLAAARFRNPDPGWLVDNYFHGESDNDWIPRVVALAAERERGALPLKPQRYGRAGGSFRHAWDRKRALGPLDRSLAGYLALAVGHPARWGFRTLRRIRRLSRPAAVHSGEPVPSGSLEASPQPQSTSSSSKPRPRVP